MPARSKSAILKASAATIGFEANLWLAADERRNSMDAAEPDGAKKTPKGSQHGARGWVHEFNTPSCVGRCVVEKIAPYEWRFYDPACGSGGRLPASRLGGVLLAKVDSAVDGSAVQSEKFVESGFDLCLFAA